MSDIREMLWEKARETLFIDKTQFLSYLGEWTIDQVEIDGRLAFVTLTKGPRFHFQSMDTGRIITRRMIRDFLQPIIDRYGYAETSTPLDDERQHRFNLAFGFRVTGEDEYDRHYRIERIPGHVQH